MPEELLLGYIGFDETCRPFTSCQFDDQTQKLPILGQSWSLRFDLMVKFCVGWLDLAQHQSHPCPDQALVDKKYDQCLTCRNRTGFNPAFYRAAEVSEQQQKLNQTPHYLYLAYFTPEVIKVGISQSARGLRRLLEQGARAAVRLETFPTALVARQYEARVAGLDGFVEHLAQGKKLALLQQPFRAEQARESLTQAVQAAERQLGVRFDQAEMIDTEQYFYHQTIDPGAAKDVTGQACIVGQAMAMIGPLLITRWQDELLAYNLKRYTGYRGRHDSNANVELPQEQLTLF